METNENSDTNSDFYGLINKHFVATCVLSKKYI